MEPDSDEEEVEYVRLDGGRERHLKMFFEGNDEGLDDQKVVLHNKMWDVYMDDKGALIKDWYSVEVSGSDGKKVLWEEVYDLF